MKKLVLFIVLFSIHFCLVAQAINIAYPTSIDSAPGQTVNIPIVCENLTHQPITVYTDYLDISPNRDQAYTINKISPREINPGRKELIFLSLTPDPTLKAGQRFFPFYVKDANHRVLRNGIVSINHIVNEELQIIPLITSKYILPNPDHHLSYLFVNRGSVPIEFKILKNNQSLIVYPGRPDTMHIKITDMVDLTRHGSMINFNMEYTLTKILPTGLVVTNHTLHNVIPVAHKTPYPHRMEFYEIPINLSYSYMYDESYYNRTNIFQNHRVSLYGSGFIDRPPSPYVAYRVNYRYNDYRFKTEDDLTYYFSLKSRPINFAFGENNYVLDLKNYQKWGYGVSAIINPNKFLLEQTFLKELYRDEPVHHVTALGYVWDKQSYLYEPEQYIKLKHYQKNSKYNDNAWYIKGQHSSIEHQKIILESQFKLTERLKLNFETYTAHDSQNEKFNNIAYATDISYNNPYINNKFTMLYDQMDITNETSRKENFTNHLNITTNWFRIYLSAQYSNESHQPTWANAYEQSSYNIFSNIYLKLYKNFFLRGKIYDSQSNITLPTKLDYSERELLSGLSYKKTKMETEMLVGIKDRTYQLDETQRYIMDFNFSFNSLKDNVFIATVYNRFLYDEEELDATTQLSIYKKWTASFSQNSGLFNTFYQNQDWRRYLTVYTYFNFKMPWNHDLKLGGTYSLNPSYQDQYRFSLSAEYNMPLNINLIPKMNDNRKNIRLLDPWQRKPISNAVLAINNHYFVTNEGGQVKIEKEKLSSGPMTILNLPEGMTVAQDLTDLASHEKYNIDIHVVKFSRLKIDVKKLTYNRVNLHEITRTPNIAYYQNTLVNLDSFTLIPYTEKLEITIRNPKTQAIHRAILGDDGFVFFDTISAGEWELIVNTQNIPDDVLYEEKILINIAPAENLDYELVLRENVTTFTKFEK